MSTNKFLIFSLMLLALIVVALPVHATSTQLGYVGSGVGPTLSVIDPNSNTVIQNITLDAWPYSVAMNPAGSYVYATVVGAFNGVDIVSIGSNTVVSRIALPANPWDIVVDNNGQYAYVSTTNNGCYIYKVNLATGTIVATINTGYYTNGRLAFNENYNELWACTNTTNIVVIDTASSTLKTTISLGTNNIPMNLAISNTAPYYFAITCNNGGQTINTLQVYYADSKAFYNSKTFPSNNVANGVAFSNGGGQIYVSLFPGSGNYISVIYTGTMGYNTNITVSSGSTKMLMSNDYSKLFATMGSGITVINTGSNTIITTIGTGNANSLAIGTIAPEANQVANQQVQYNFHSGFNTFYQGVSVSEYNTQNQLLASNSTDVNGLTAFVQSPASSYTMNWSYGTTKGTFTIQPTETHYYVDISTGDVTPASQAGGLVGATHAVGITVTNWFIFAVPNANVLLATPGQNQTIGITDSFGRVTLWAYNTGTYNITVYNTTQGLYKNLQMSLSGSSYTIDCTGCFNTTQTQGGQYESDGGTKNNTGSVGNTGHPDQDIQTSVSGNVVGNNGTITINYTDVSLSTTQISFQILTQNQSNLSAPLVQLANPTFNQINVSYTYNVGTNYAGTSYDININSTYNNGNGGVSTINRVYTYSFNGPLRAIPGMPVKWYKYFAWAILIVIGLVAGKFGVEEASIAIVLVATIEWAMRWWYETPDATMILILGAVWVIAIGITFFKREREGRM